MKITVTIFSMCFWFIHGNAQDLKRFEGENGKYGFVDKTGKVIVPATYDIAFDFSEGLGQVKLNDKCGFIDRTGKIIIPIEYDTCYDFKEGLAPVKLNRKWGYVEKKEK